MSEKRRFKSVLEIIHERIMFNRLLSALMRFSMDLHLSQEELAGMTSLERNCSKHISVVNDIFSWEKELQASKTGHSEGSVLCTAVKVLAEETHLGIGASKRVLWSMAREWENVHDEMVAEKVAHNCTQAARDYMQGLEYQMSGNELWSRTTLRYNKLEQTV
jgi:aristolochene synthase